MSIESILKEYLQRYEIQEVQFNTKGMFSTIIDKLGLFSCEHIQDGIIIALFQTITPSEQSLFMERALKSVNPLDGNLSHSLRPVLYEDKAGIVAPLQKEAISLPTVSTLVDTLFRTLQNTLRA